MLIGASMLIIVAVVLVATGLPAWSVLLGVAILFGIGGAASGAIAIPLLTAAPARLLESDILQALPLYALMGALLNRLPLAQALFRTGSRALARTGAGPELAGLGLGVLLAPMNGSVGASVSMLARSVHPRLTASGVEDARGAALVCVASTLGVVVPPSLVLILLGDAMLRAHTEALNVTGASMRIINTQDIFTGALVPALLVLVSSVALTWWRARTAGRTLVIAPEAPTRTDVIVASVTALFIVGLLTAVTLGYLYAVEGAAFGGVVLVAYGIASRTLTAQVLREVLADTLEITGALFALLAAATMFTLVLRSFGTDRALASALVGLPGGATAAVAVVMAVLGSCALVLDAFELIFVVVPIVMPPLLALAGNVTWVAVLSLLILQASFLAPPFGYAVLIARNKLPHPPPLRALTRTLAPYLIAQLCVLGLVAAWPSLVWQRNPLTLPVPTHTSPETEEAQRRMLEEQLNRTLPPSENENRQDP